MTFLIGKTEQGPSGPADLGPFRDMLLKYLGANIENLNPSSSDASNDPSLAPYRALFEQQNKLGLAQAKESAGNLTGSGFAASLGNYAARANAEQGGFLANLLESRNQNNANRLAQLFGALGTAGVQTPQQTYKPGFLDYAAQGLSAAAQGGAFNKLFGGGKPA